MLASWGSSVTSAIRAPTRRCGSSGGDAPGSMGSSSTCVWSTSPACGSRSRSRSGPPWTSRGSSMSSMAWWPTPEPRHDRRARCVGRLSDPGHPPRLGRLDGQRCRLGWTVEPRHARRGMSTLTLEVAMLAPMPHTFRPTVDGLGWVVGLHRRASRPGPRRSSGSRGRGRPRARRSTVAGRHVRGRRSPWYFTLFGRDSLWAARFTLPISVDLAHGTLRTLADVRDEGTGTSEAPGKILHEVRNDLAGSTPAARLLRHHRRDAAVGLRAARRVVLGMASAMSRRCSIRWTPPSPGSSTRRQRRRRVPRLRRPQRPWSRQSGLEGLGRFDPVPGRDARPAADLAQRGPGLRLRGGDLGCAAPRRVRPTGRRSAAGVGGRAAGAIPGGVLGLDERGRFPAIALDGARRRSRRPRPTSATCWRRACSIRARSPLVADRLRQPDLDSGYGLRTMSAEVDGFNPLGYHTGSVWPHDTAIAIRGSPALAMRTSRPRSRPASFEPRRPSTITCRSCAADRRRTGDPVLAYPAACRPLAWSGGAAMALAPGGHRPRGRRPGRRPARAPPPGVRVVVPAARRRDCGSPGTRWRSSLVDRSVDRVTVETTAPLADRRLRADALRPVANRARSRCADSPRPPPRAAPGRHRRRARARTPRRRARTPTAGSPRSWQNRSIPSRSTTARSRDVGIVAGHRSDGDGQPDELRRDIHLADPVGVDERPGSRCQSGTIASSSSRRTRVSRRPRCTPMQVWGPFPNPTWGFGLRSSTDRSRAHRTRRGRGWRWRNRAGRCHLRRPTPSFPRPLG